MDVVSGRHELRPLHNNVDGQEGKVHLPRELQRDKVSIVSRSQRLAQRGQVDFKGDAVVGKTFDAVRGEELLLGQSRAERTKIHHREGTPYSNCVRPSRHVEGNVKCLHRRELHDAVLRNLLKEAEQLCKQG